MCVLSISQRPSHSKPSGAEQQAGSAWREDSGDDIEVDDDDDNDDDDEEGGSSDGDALKDGDEGVKGKAMDAR